jgi:hypothetical protein
MVLILRTILLEKLPEGHKEFVLQIPVLTVEGAEHGIGQILDRSAVHDMAQFFEAFEGDLIKVFFLHHVTAIGAQPGSLVPILQVCGVHTVNVFAARSADKGYI